MRALLSLGLLSLGALAAACEDDALGFVPPPIDAGFPDAAPLPEPMDAGFADAEPAPDAMPPPPAREPIYIHTGSTLYAYDPDTNTAAPIGDFKAGRTVVDDMADIAIDRQGRMFGGTVERKVYLINPLTAACEHRFDVEDRVHGMTFLPSGELVLAGDFVRVIHTETGRVVRELVDDQGYQTSGDIVGLPDGKLYWTVRGGRGQGDLVVRIDPTNGRLTELGSANAERIYGLGYADDVLFGFSADGAVVELEPRTGSVLRELMLDARWWGATTNPVVW